MYQTQMAVYCLMLAFCLFIGAEVASAETQKMKESKGITVDDLGHGLKSAAQNVEKEIPKIGPAIGETFKKMTGKNSDKKPAQEPAKDKK